MGGALLANPSVNRLLYGCYGAIDELSAARCLRRCEGLRTRACDIASAAISSLNRTRLRGPLAITEVAWVPDGRTRRRLSW